ncbi:MAG TPA: hypothetical protein VLM36_14675 [Sphingomicrobium sp.]|nr:hypothetical protein [Sphingomicrobium sp.]
MRVPLARGENSAGTDQGHGYGGGNDEARENQDEHNLEGTSASSGFQFGGTAIHPEKPASGLLQDALTDQRLKLVLMEVRRRIIWDGAVGIDRARIVEMPKHFSPRSGKGCGGYCSC